MKKTRKLAAKVLLATLTVGGASAGLVGVSGAAQPAVGTASHGQVADAKAPAGLLDNTRSQGHKCNTNRGAGQGNPALSGCSPDAPAEVGPGVDEAKDPFFAS